MYVCIYICKYIYMYNCFFLSFSFFFFFFFFQKFVDIFNDVPCICIDYTDLYMYIYISRRTESIYVAKKKKVTHIYNADEQSVYI